MKRTESREVEVRYCDFCREEATHTSTCPICRRDMCNGEGGKKHTAYSVEIYRYEDGDHLSVPICQDCASKPMTGTVKEFIDIMFKR
jgi:hypothetical protein